MAPNKSTKPCGGLLLISVSIVLLLFLVFVLVVPRRKEGFQVEGAMGGTGITSRSLYRFGQPKDFMKSLIDNTFALDDQGDTFIMMGCYQFPPYHRGMLYRLQCPLEVVKVNTRRDIRNHDPSLPFPQFDTMRESIVQRLIEVRDDINKGNRDGAAQLKGPVYVVIEQAPYYRDCREGRCRNMAVQYHISDYRFSPLNVMREDVSLDDFTSTPIYMRATLIFAHYEYDSDRKWIQRSTPVNVRMLLENYRTKKNMCYIHCPMDTGTFCGCANTRRWRGHPYTATCTTIKLNPKTEEDRTNARNFDIVNMYLINPDNADIMRSNVFSTDDTLPSLLQ